MSERIERLIGQMTLEEKAAQILQIPYAQTGREESLRWADRGAGSFLHVLGDEAREVQQQALHSRLGIPVLFGIDAVRGHALNDHGTIFPTQLACACSWNPETAEAMGRTTAREVAADGLHWTFSPLLCLSRDPRWGRVNETFGEDPFLTGEMAAAMIRGYQGENLADPESIAACAKHFIAYGEATGARDACDSSVTYRKIREVFLPPFQKAIDAGCATIMTAYGAIDGTPLTADRHMLRDILRDESGFDGFVITDWANVTSLRTRQHVAESAEEAAELALSAGNDMIMNSMECYEAVIRLVRDGRMEEAVLDGAVRHILTIKERMGLFEQPEKKVNPGVIGCAAHQETALRAARQSVTLLKNNGLLPLKNRKKLAVIGGNADDLRAQYGDWTYFTHPLPNPEHPAVRPYTTIREGVEQLAAERQMECVYSYGCGPIPSGQDNLDAAVACAREADAILLVVGDEISQIGEEKDRADLTLSGRQLELFERLRALGIPLAVILLASKPLVMGPIPDQADAVMVAFNGGAHGGRAVAEALFGVINPSGRLPISFPRHSGQVPVYYNQLPGWHGGKYCDLPETPQYAFGEGLSYTDFAYRDFQMDPESLTASVKVRNTGDRAGRETVQLYFRDCVSSVLTPIKSLIAFRQVDLEPGEEKTVTFNLRRSDFSIVNRQEKRVVEPGEFILMAGHSSRDADLQQLRFRLEAES